MEKRQSRSRQRKKIQKSEWEDWLEPCRLCPRDCGSRRLSGVKGRCGVSALLKVSRAALHLWEEPCISGTEGSGTVFFSGCHCTACTARTVPSQMDGPAKRFPRSVWGDFSGTSGKRGEKYQPGDSYPLYPQIRRPWIWRRRGAWSCPLFSTAGGTKNRKP